MSRPQAQLRAIAKLANAAAGRWSDYEEVQALLAPSVIPGGGGDGRGTDVANPTLTSVVAHQRYFETADKVARALALLRDIQTQLKDIRHHPDVARDIDAAKRAALCDGSVDPFCAELSVVKNYRGSGQSLCSKCRSRSDRGEAKADRDARRVQPGGVR